MVRNITEEKFVIYYSSEGTEIGAADRNRTQGLCCHHDYRSLPFLLLFCGDSEPHEKSQTQGLSGVECCSLLRCNIGRCWAPWSPFLTHAGQQQWGGALPRFATWYTRRSRRPWDPCGLVGAAWLAWGGWCLSNDGTRRAHTCPHEERVAPPWIVVNWLQQPGGIPRRCRNFLWWWSKS